MRRRARAPGPHGAPTPGTGPGTLYLVATPIGNLQDISLRALDVLGRVAVIAAEDTRRTTLLTRHYEITTPLISYFDQNEDVRAAELLRRLQAGDDVAVVSDAGTPGVQDPGYGLLQLAITHEIPVTAVPGPTALIAALCVSGLPADSFVFEGFLPAKPGPRRERLRRLGAERRTVLLYETPHRLLRALRDIQEVLGDIPLVVARELTKAFEDVRRGLVSEHLAHFAAQPPRGEFVLAFNLRVGQAADSP